MNWLYFYFAVLGGILSISDYIKTGKPYKLIYVLFWAYFFIGTPVLGRVMSNSSIDTTIFAYIAVGVSASLIFAYWDIRKTLKAR